MRLFTPGFLNNDPLPAPIIHSIKNPNPIADKSMAQTMPTQTQPDPVTGAPISKGIAIQNSWNVRRGQHTSFATLTNARAMARLAALMAHHGELDGVRIIDEETAKNALVEDPFDGIDHVLRMQIPFTIGGFGMAKGRWVPNTPAEDKWLARGKGWLWRGWAGFGGSMFQFEADRKIAYA